MRTRPPAADHPPPPAWLDELQLTPGPPWHGMGTRALDPGRWLLRDGDREAKLAQKRRLVAEQRDVVVAWTDAAGTRAAAAEVAELVGVDPGGTAPLLDAALAVQEDLCLLERDERGRWILTAGVVCFPSLWRLADKVGLPLAEVHGPVPAYAEELAARVDGFVERLRPERPVWRRNWLVHDVEELHLPEPPPPPPRPAPPDVPGGLWLRSERQTLRRLVRTDAVLFTIGTQQVPLAAVAARPDIAAGLAAAIESWSPDLVRYRRAAAWREQAVRWLATR